ncbi:MAG: cytochrome c maturation protein CcmE [Candidatus Competibacterales bacterium]|nr:cytochrome c maturation protein CcmE [Candidatus Competibacterales bacterium]
MTPRRRRRLFLVLGILFGVGVAVSLTVYALRQNINLFFTPTQIAAGEAPLERTIRIGGLVVPGSVKRDPDSLDVRFDLSDNRDAVTVTYTGILPDLFREGQGIIARGRLQADNRLVAEALKQAGMPHEPKTQP